MTEQDKQAADLHAAIMNLRCLEPQEYQDAAVLMAYRVGHRDARHAAAELTSATLRAAQQVQEPVWWIGEYQGPYRMMGALFRSEAAAAGFISGEKGGRYYPVPHSATASQPEMPALTDAMRAVLRNERDVYGSEDELYAALCKAAVAPASQPVGTTPTSSCWFALAMNAAAALEDAANCLCDPDAKKAATGAAEHVRARIRELDSRAAPADKQRGGLTEDEKDHFVAVLMHYGTGFAAPLYEVVGQIERAVLARVAPSEQRDELGLTESDWRKIEQQAEKARGVDDAIAKSKRILALVDDYAERQTSERRTALRVALMNEFEALLAAPAAATARDEIPTDSIDHLTRQKAAHIIARDGFRVSGVVMSKPNGSVCIVDRSAVRWLTGDELFSVMHPAAPQAATGAQGLTAEQIAMVAAPYIRPVQRGMFAEDLAAALAASQPHGGKDRG